MSPSLLDSFHPLLQPKKRTQRQHGQRRRISRSQSRKALKDFLPSAGRVARRKRWAGVNLWITVDPDTTNTIELEAQVRVSLGFVLIKFTSCIKAQIEDIDTIKIDCKRMVQTVEIDFKRMEQTVETLPMAEEGEVNKKENTRKK